MQEAKISTQKLITFGRFFSLLLIRATMYDTTHPYCRQSIDEFLPIAQDILKSFSPLVFMMNQGQFFIDEEPIDPRINISKIVAYFKRTQLQSISFYDGIEKNDIETFLNVFTNIKKYPNAEAMKKALQARGIHFLKVNHVYFKKVSSDEEIVSRDALEKISPDVIDPDRIRSKKLFMDMILESVLTEEFEKALTIKNLTHNPGEISKKMIDADLAAYHQSEAEDRQVGSVLAHQLQIIEHEVEKKLTVAGGKELSDLALAVINMKRQLINGLEFQKSLGISYANEEEILAKVNEITDKVVIKLIKDEYKNGEISTERLAHIIRRLIPEPDELKRLLPKIKDALLEEGMPLSDYVNLLQELSNELQSEELAKLLQQSAETIGLDGEELVQKVKNNPVQAAELIFLAAEIQKGTGDDNVLTDLLVDYVERLGSKLTLDIAEEDGVEGEEHLRKVMNNVESEIIGRLKSMDVKNDVLARLEQRLNNRMDEIYEKLKNEWMNRQPGQNEKDKRPDLTILQLLEQNVSENDELAGILSMVRSEVQSRGINDNDFKQIYTEITRQKKKVKEGIPEGILDRDGLMFFLEKEISRSKRYDLPFATLSFSIIKAKPKAKPPSGEITQQSLIRAMIQKFAAKLRAADVAALLEKKQLVALLPMTPKNEARRALNRHLKIFNTEPVEVNGVPVSVHVAGVATNYDPDKTPNADAFVETLAGDLSEMVARIKNIHGLA